MKARGLAVLLVGTILSSNVLAVDTNGTCGTNCSWKIENDVLTVYPTVAGQQVVMDNYSNVQTGDEENHYKVRTTAPWGESYQTVTSVVVADGINTVSDRAFQGFRNVTSVSMPDTLTTIGNLAFDRMPSLTSVDIPDAVTSIGRAAFQYAASIESLNFGENSQLQTIGGNAFYQASSLAEVNLPSTLKVIGDSAFYYATALTSIDLPDGLETIGMGAFTATSLGEIKIPDSVKIIGQSAFNQAYAYTDLTDRIDTIVLSENLEQIGNKAFSRSTATSIILPESLFADGRELNPYAFEYMALDTIYCPEGNQKCLSYVPMLCLGEDTDFGCDGESEPLSKQPTFNTYRQDANGNYIMNGIRYSSFADMVQNRNAHPMKKIYTVEEAAKASKDTGNTFKLRYK